MFNESLCANLLQIAALIFASVQLTRNAFSRWESDESSKAWLNLAFGGWVWVIGQFMEGYAEHLLHESAYGTVADGFWLIGVFAIVRGLYIMLLHYSNLKRSTRGRYLIVCLLLALLAVFEIEPAGKFYTRILELMYPMFDLMAIALLTALVIACKKRRDPRAVQWAIFLVGASIGTIGDFLWAAGQDKIPDLSFLIDYSLVGVSATLHVRHRVVRPSTPCQYLTEWHRPEGK